MKLSFNRYPVDLLLCIIWSIILLPIAIFGVEGVLRLILGLPFIIFIPGYTLIFVLFPGKKTEGGIDLIQRIALSFGVSIALVAFIGIGISYNLGGIRLESILISILLFVIITVFLGFFRWLKKDPDARFIISFDLKLPKSENKLDKLLVIILVVVILIAVTFFIYVIMTPKTGEKSTEFYLLGPSGLADNYPENLAAGENSQLIIGLINHESQTVNYNIEIWLINQTTSYNITLDENQTMYHNMWFMDKISVKLDHIKMNNDEQWKPQGEYNYNFSIDKKGKFKLAFLLFKEPQGSYEKSEDYKSIAEQKINSAYQDLYLWINVN